MGRAYTSWILRTDFQSTFPSISGENCSALSSLQWLGVGGKLFTWPSEVGWAWQDSWARQEEAGPGRCMSRSNRTRLHSRLRVKPGFPGWDLWTLSTVNRASWVSLGPSPSQILAQNWQFLSWSYGSDYVCVQVCASVHSHMWAHTHMSTRLKSCLCVHCFKCANACVCTWTCMCAGLVCLYMCARLHVCGSVAARTRECCLLSCQHCHRCVPQPGAAPDVVPTFLIHCRKSNKQMKN